MDKAFKKVFKDSLKRQVQQSEAARQELEGILGNLRAGTEQMMVQGAYKMPIMPITVPRDPMSAMSPSGPFNVVSKDWIKLAIQAASIDEDFLQEVGAKATQIVMAAIQNSPAPPSSTSKDPISVSTGPDSG